MNAIEVEYKFRISRAQHTLLVGTIRQLCTQCAKIKICDEYFAFQNSPSSQCVDVRLRQSRVVSEDTISSHDHTHVEVPSTTAYYMTYKNKTQRKQNTHSNVHEPRLLQGEINEEHETKIEDYQVMKGLLLLLHGALLIVKEKRGYTYTVPMKNSTAYKKFAQDLSVFKDHNIIVELLEVPPLGYFLEIEVLLPNESTKSQIQSVQKMLLEFADQLGITTHTQIEPKLYIDLLRERAP